jgi:hypothetical protein
VLQNKRERVEELGLEAQELRAKREIERLQEEDSQAERARTTEARAQVLAHRRALEETRLLREQNAERRAREQRQAQGENERAEFSRRWLRWASNSFPEWLTTEQQQFVTGAVKTQLAECEPGEPDSEVLLIVQRTIERTVAPWRAEREEQIRREKLIEQAVWRLPWGATDGDKARASASARAALSGLSRDVSGAGLRVALDDALAPTKQAIEERQARARREQLITSAGNWLPYNSTQADKSEAAEAVRAALLNLPLGVGQGEEQSVLAAALAPIKRAIEERAAAEAERAHRERTKSSLLTFAVFHALNYLDKEYSEGSIELEPGEEFYELRRDVEATVRKALEQELTGDESQHEADEIGREIVDEELE